MPAVAPIFENVSESCNAGFGLESSQGTPVSVISAGVAYPGIRTPTELVQALLAGSRLWNGEQSGLTERQDLEEVAVLRHREARKLDRFSVLALAAAHAAIHESQVDSEFLSECGIYSGNMVGGWTFTEPQVRALHRDGLEAVSPYLATAWFPGAPQGQISIHMKLRGFAKTVTTDRCCGAQAVGLAFERIRAGLKPQALLAGGVEAPMTPFVDAAVNQIPGSSTRVVEAAAYVLLSAGLTGCVQISAHSTFPVGLLAGDLIDQIAKRVANFVSSQSLSLPDIVLCNLPLVRDLEDGVVNVVRTSFGKEVAFFFPTHIFGETLAASGALAAVAASEMLARFETSSILILSAGHQCGDLLLMTRSGGYPS